MKKFKAVIFDLDDTLYDQASYIDQGFQRAARRVQKDFNLSGKQRTALLKKMRGLYKSSDRVRIFNRALEWLMPKMERQKINDYIEQGLLYYYKLCPRKISVWPQAEALLDFLRRKKMRLGLVTQGQVVDQMNKLFELGLEDAFDAVEISGFYPASKAKPSPFMFKRILRRLDVSAGEALFVGNDFLKDSGAVKAGMPFYYLTRRSQLLELRKELAK